MAEHQKGVGLFFDPVRQAWLRDCAALVQNDNWMEGEPGYADAQELVFVEVDFPIDRIRTRQPEKPFSWISWFTAEQEMHEEDGRPGYYDSLLNSDIVTAVVIYDDGKFGYVWDGYHRVGATVTRGLDTVKAIVGYRPQDLENQSDLVILANETPQGEGEKKMAQKLESNNDLKMFEVMAAGFDDSTVATDDCIFWIASSSEDAVKTAILDTGAVFAGEVLGATLTDADFQLPGQSIMLSAALLEKASDLRNLNRPATAVGHHGESDTDNHDPAIESQGNGGG